MNKVLFVEISNSFKSKMTNHWWATPQSMTSRSLGPADLRKYQHHKVKLELVESGLASKSIPMVSHLD